MRQPQLKQHLRPRRGVRSQGLVERADEEVDDAVVEGLLRGLIVGGRGERGGAGDVGGDDQGLEIEAAMPTELRQSVQRALGVGDAEVFLVEGVLALSELNQMDGDSIRKQRRQKFLDIGRKLP